MKSSLRKNTLAMNTKPTFSNRRRYVRLPKSVPPIPIEGIEHLPARERILLALAPEWRACTDIVHLADLDKSVAQILFKNLCNTGRVEKMKDAHRAYYRVAAE